MMVAAGLVLACGGSASTDAGSGPDGASSSGGVGPSTGAPEPPASTSSGMDSTGGSSGSGPDDTTTDGTTAEASTGKGGELRDPTVFRTPDRADVCGPTPRAPCAAGDMAWVATEYGMELTRADDPWVDAHGAVYRLIALVERLGPSNIDVFVVDQDGAPIADTPVAFYYDSLRNPARPDEWYPVKVEAITDVQGRAGFALGPGAYLDTCGGGGPHAIWVSEPGVAPDTTVASDLADRLGMLGGTNHRHLDLLFQRVSPGAAVSPGTCPLSG